MPNAFAVPIRGRAEIEGRIRSFDVRQAERHFSARDTSGRLATDQRGRPAANSTEVSAFARGLYSREPCPASVSPVYRVRLANRARLGGDPTFSPNRAISLNAPRDTPRPSILLSSATSPAARCQARDPLWRRPTRDRTQRSTHSQTVERAPSRHQRPGRTAPIATALRVGPDELPAGKADDRHARATPGDWAPRIRTHPPGGHRGHPGARDASERRAGRAAAPPRTQRC